MPETWSRNGIHTVKCNRSIFCRHEKRLEPALPHLGCCDRHRHQETIEQGHSQKQKTCAYFPAATLILLNVDAVMFLVMHCLFVSVHIYKRCAHMLSLSGTSLVWSPVHVLKHMWVLLECLNDKACSIEIVPVSASWLK